MKVFKAEFESGNWCYIFAESEEWAWHYFDKVMYECYSIKSFEEVGKTIAGIVYVYSGVTKNQNLPDNNGELYMCRHERLERWYELIWYYCQHYWWKLFHSFKVLECRREKEITEMFLGNNSKINHHNHEKDNHSG
jgi:hypothetical protein